MKYPNCEKCGSELKEFDKDNMYCINVSCPTQNDCWDRLILKEQVEEEI